MLGNLLPSSSPGLDMELTEEGKEFTLSKILKEIENEYSYIFFDLSPSLGNKAGSLGISMPRLPALFPKKLVNKLIKKAFKNSDVLEFFYWVYQR